MSAMSSVFFLALSLMMTQHFAFEGAVLQLCYSHLVVFPRYFNFISKDPIILQKQLFLFKGTDRCYPHNFGLRPDAEVSIVRIRHRIANWPNSSAWTNI